MALRVLLRNSASRAWFSGAAGCLSPWRQSDFTHSSSPLESIQSTSACSGAEFLRFSSIFSPRSLPSASDLWRVAPRSPASLVAPLSVQSSSHGQLCPLAARIFADPSLGRERRGMQQLGADSLMSSASMQQRRGLSKLKKYKIKAYSLPLGSCERNQAAQALDLEKLLDLKSYKERFKAMADGTFKRWRSGKRHNAHSKTQKQRRQLRKPSIAPLALAKVMKKLNFMG